MKKDFTEFMQFKKGKKDKDWKLNYEREHYDPKRKNQRLNSNEFSLKTAHEMSLKMSQQD